MKADRPIIRCKERRLRCQLLSCRMMPYVTQQALADALGVSRKSIHAIENDKSVPSVRLALRLAETLGVSVEDLFRFEPCGRGRRRTG